MEILRLTSYIVVDVLIVVITAGLILYKLFTRNFDYWKKKGVPYVRPIPFFGNFWDVFTFRSSIGHMLAKHYNQFKTPYFGIYVLNKPHLVVRSPDLIKSIMVKDFNYFYDRTVTSDEKCDSITSKMLFIVKNPEWKLMRSKISPVFTAGKIKSMVALINGAAGEMNTYVCKNASKGSIEAKELCAKYSTDVIATCAFGINAHSFECENAQFRVIGRKMFDFHWKTSLRQTCYFMAPSMVKLFKMPFLDQSITDFMRDVFWKTINERENTQHKRNDVIDIILQIRNQGIARDDIRFEGDRVVAQAAQFYVAGFETVSSTMSFTLYELCLQPQIQRKLRSEIKSTVAQYGGFTYESVQNMKYLHMVICETLRKYPVLPFLDRMCMKDYKVPDSDLVIEKGTPVYIPMYGIHYDPQYFPDPETYNPDRFSDQNKGKLSSFSYIPFGDGPRNCIGERFGLLATKIGIAQLLLEFEVERSADTPVPIQFETKSFMLASVVGLPMTFRKTVSVAA